MTNFVIEDREYPHLVELLMNTAPRFAESDEFGRLTTADHALPSVVLGAFTRYVERLNIKSRSSSSEIIADEVDDTFRAIERLAASADPEVANAVVVEVLEHLDLPDQVLRDFYARLGPSAQNAYDRWMGARERDAEEPA